MLKLNTFHTNLITWKQCCLSISNHLHFASPTFTYKLSAVLFRNYGRKRFSCTTVAYVFSSTFACAFYRVWVKGNSRCSSFTSTSRQNHLPRVSDLVLANSQYYFPLAIPWKRLHFPGANDESLYTFSISGCIFGASELLRLQFWLLCIKLVHSFFMLCSQAFNMAVKMADVQFVLASSFLLS